MFDLSCICDGYIHWWFFSFCCCYCFNLQCSQFSRKDAGAYIIPCLFVLHFFIYENNPQTTWSWIPFMLVIPDFTLLLLQFNMQPYKRDHKTLNILVMKMTKHLSVSFALILEIPQISANWRKFSLDEYSSLEFTDILIYFNKLNNWLKQHSKDRGK